MVAQHPRVPRANASEDRPLGGTGVTCPTGIADAEPFKLSD